jgi:hypothetical protein
MSAAITTQKVRHMELGPFWKKNASLLSELARTKMPPKSRLIFKEISTSHDKRHNADLTEYELVNIYDNRKNFLRLSVEFGPDESIRKEEILVGSKLTDGKKTVLDGSKITNKAHIDWLKDMHKDKTCQLFRA